MSRPSYPAGRVAHLITAMAKMVKSSGTIDLRFASRAWPFGSVGHVLHRLHEKCRIAIARRPTERLLTLIEQDEDTILYVPRETVNPVTQPTVLIGADPRELRARRPRSSSLSSGEAMVT